MLGTNDPTTLHVCISVALSSKVMMFNFVVEKSEDVDIDLKNFKLNEEDAMEKTDRVVGKVFFVPCSIAGGRAFYSPVGLGR